MNYPRMFKIRQEFTSGCLADVDGAVREELRRIKLAKLVKPGDKIAIAASARGIRDQAVIIRALVGELKGAGARPFIFPAMGSHGGAEAEGQAALLREYNITEEFTGAPVRSSIDADLIGTTDRGIPVYADRNACAARGIILVNRIKAHIDFEGAQESGLYKMTVAGLGKPIGAKYFHLYASQFGYHSVLREMAVLALDILPIIAGIGVVENARGETETIKALTREQIKEGAAEADLLKRAKTKMARLPFEEIDLLIVDEIGKDIAGSGLDTNVIGRKGEMHTWQAQKPRVKRILIRGLTNKTMGNALGMGYADFTTRRLLDRVDYQQTNVNAITSHAIHEAKIPIVMENEKAAVDAALSTLGPVKPEDTRVVHIKNTLELSIFEASKACLEELKGKQNITIDCETGEMRFDGEGNLV